MNEKITKMKKSSHLMAIFFKIFRIFAYVALSVIVVSMIFILMFPSGGVSVGNTNILSGIAYDNGQPISTYDQLLENLPSLLSLICWIVALIFVFYMTGSIFTDIEKTESPFSEINVKRLRNISILLLASSIVPNGVELIASYAMGVGTNIELINGVALSVGLVLICLSHVFDYGVQIQQENDELL